VFLNLSSPGGKRLRTLRIEDIPDEGLDLQWEEDRAPLLTYLKGLSRIDFDFETPLLIAVEVRKPGRAVFLKGSVRTVLRLQCVRCLKEFPYPLASTFDLTLHPLKETSFGDEKELSEEEMESNFFEGGQIHLSEIACEQIFLEIPYQPLCGGECKGLCQGCGKDLNVSECQCGREGEASTVSASRGLKTNG
jgi:uncharacterized protein